MDKMHIVIDKEIVDTLIATLTECRKELAAARQRTDNELMTPEETAKLLKVTTVTVYRWTRKGILKPLDIAEEVRYRYGDVMAAVIARRP